LRASKVENVKTSIAYAFPKISQDGEKNLIFGNILPESLAEEVLDGIARDRKEIFIPGHMVFLFWVRLLPSPVVNMIENFLFKNN
jgi:hypothetical protein